MKISKTKIGVSIFILILISAVFASKKVSANDTYIELGRTFLNSTNSVGGFGYRIEDDEGAWDFHVGLMGEGKTNLGQQDQEFFYSVSRIIYPDWRIFGVEIMPRLGLAKTNNFELIGANNYRLGLIANFEVFEIEFVHYSSADINSINTGVDFISLRVLF